jgi:hypothetical protein
MVLSKQCWERTSSKANKIVILFTLLERRAAAIGIFNYI